MYTEFAPFCLLIFFLLIILLLPCVYLLILITCFIIVLKNIKIVFIWVSFSHENGFAIIIYSPYHPSCFTNLNLTATNFEFWVKTIIKIKNNNHNNLTILTNLFTTYRRKWRGWWRRGIARAHNKCGGRRDHGTGSTQWMVGVHFTPIHATGPLFWRNKTDAIMNTNYLIFLFLFLPSVETVSFFLFSFFFFFSFQLNCLWFMSFSYLF